MKFFTRNEIIGVSLILALVVGLTLFNFREARRKSRNVERKANINHVASGLINFNDDFAIFPSATEDGRIIACLDPAQPESLTPCQWGQDALRDVTDPGYPAYVERLPLDPQNEDGLFYVYISNGRHFQLYASLENDAEEQPGIVARGISCGPRLCNYGKSDGRTPLDKSLEEYENELLEQSKKQ